MQAKEELKYILTNIRETLKYYDAKHSGLVALNAGLVYASVSSYINVQAYIYKPAIVVSIFGFGISIFCSFLANFLSPRKIFYKKKKIENPNLYNYAHLSYLNNATFNIELYKINENYTSTKLDNDLIDEIILYAKLAHSKYDYYKFATYLTASGSGLIGVSSFIMILLHL